MSKAIGKFVGNVLGVVVDIVLIVLVVGGTGLVAHVVYRIGETGWSLV
jgi:hypothetical protein